MIASLAQIAEIGMGASMMLSATFVGIRTILRFFRKLQRLSREIEDIQRQLPKCSHEEDTNHQL
jgi:hypothetical protein